MARIFLERRDLDDDLQRLFDVLTTGEVRSGLNSNNQTGMQAADFLTAGSGAGRP